MSKSFELLQNLGKEKEILEAAVGLSPLPSSAREPTPYQLETEARQREELAKFVQQVFSGQADDPRSSVFAATEGGNGCSWTCCRAGEILASGGRGPVCIVDANFRSPGLHRQFAVENHHGLSDALQGTDPIPNYVCRITRNLWLLSCGAHAIDFKGLLTSESMRFRLKEMREYFEYVLIDAPALTWGNDGIMLARATEGVVLVLKANFSRREVVLKAVQDLEKAGVHILGAVLNQRTFPIPQLIYNKL